MAIDQLATAASANRSAPLDGNEQPSYLKVSLDIASMKSLGAYGWLFRRNKDDAFPVDVLGTRYILMCMKADALALKLYNGGPIVILSDTPLRASLET